MGGFGAELGQVQQGSEKVLEQVWEASVQSQGRFNRLRGRFREALAHSQVRFNRVLDKVLEKVPAKVRVALVQSQVNFNTGLSGSQPWRKAKSGSRKPS